MFKDGNTERFWKPGHIVKVLGDRDYLVRGESEGLYRRNRVDIRPSGAKFELQPEFSDKTRVSTQENQESKVNNKPLVNQTPLHGEPENITDNQKTIDTPKEMIEAKNLKRDHNETGNHLKG